jgi:hypothetical protein
LGEEGTLEVYDTQVNGRAKALVRATQVTTISKGRSAFLSTWLKPKGEPLPAAKKEDVTLYEFDSDIGIFLRHAVVGLVADPQGGLKLDITDLDFSLDIPWRLPKFVLEQISNRIEDTIKKDFPAIDVSKMASERISSFVPFTPDLKVTQVSTDGSEVLIMGNMGFLETPKQIYPVPSYVADERTSSKEVHRADCRSVHRIPERSRVGYTSLYDALADGLRGARDCLPEVARGLEEKESVIGLPEIKVQVGGAREKEPPKVPELSPIPIVGDYEPVVREVMVVRSTEQASDGTGHEVQGEDDQKDATTPEEEPVPFTREERPRPVDRKGNEL